MIIGVPKEIKQDEYRVAMTPPAQEHIAIRRGVNVIGGKLVCRAVAEAFGMPCDTF